MKKVLAIVALVAALFVAGNVQAQNMVYVGYAPETLAYSNSTANFQGFYAGFTKNIGISNGIGVAAGAQFRLNTRNTEDSFWGITGKVKETQILVDVPLLFNYGIAINRDLKITPFIGPMFSLGLVGKTQGNDPIFGDHSSDWYGENGVAGRPNNRFNISGVFGADVTFSRFNLFAGYNMGLMDLAKSENVTMKTSGFFVGLGYSL